MKSDLAGGENWRENKQLGEVAPGHCRLGQKPQEKPGATGAKTSPACPLGRPLDIKQAAVLIGCSVWSVRYALLPKGLPYFRSRPGGKLIFYSDQVTAWILKQQTERRNQISEPV